ncbi:MAG: hypothetical protein NC911_00945 [Candidatus Omnitrophica bacterium]|nr:hypothetical protein [Candidatus Omnitrophota bacterium]MCM8768243.1 hypothetical protein [Candidatus Omnitrophota bacterium]
MRRECRGLLLLLLPASLGFTWEFLNPRPLEKEKQEEVIIKGTEKFVNRQYEEKFPLAAKLPETGWFSVDLKPYCNVNIFSDAGQTTPVKYPFMNLGKQVFYGVPFEIIFPEANENRTAIALASTYLLTNTLPDTIEVPVGRKSVVFYFLHTTYYTDPSGEQFYRINYDDGTSHTIKIIGRVHSGDWYHADTRIYTEDVHYVLVPAAKDSKTFHRNMHILQWKNPFPEKIVKSITFHSDRKAPMGIFIVAVTGHGG